MTYNDIQNEVIKRYGIKLDPYSSCRCRMHAHVKERKICKWFPKNSIRATFDLLHEIGHIETTKSWMRRCESEFYATQWALDRCKEYGITVPDRIVSLYQDYINREHDRGVRRHGKHMPSIIDLILQA